MYLLLHTIAAAHANKQVAFCFRVCCYHISWNEFLDNAIIRNIFLGIIYKCIL